MKVRIPSDLLYQVLFVLCIAVPNLYNYELTFATWSLTAAVTISRRYSLYLLKQIACFILILAIATAVTFLYEYKLYYIVRDITYLIKPVLGLLVGYQLCRKTNATAFRLIIFAGFITALLHLAQLFNAFVFLHARTMIEIRMHAGYFSDFEVYSLVFLLFHKKLGLEYSRRKVLVMGGVLGFSIFMYMARTNFIQFIIIWMALKGYFIINRRSIIIVSTVFVSALLAYSAILYINPKRNGQGLEALLYKIKIAPIEPFKTRINKENWKEFHDNYRSYENILTVRQLTAEGERAVAFGKGLGSTVDLNKEVWLDKGMLRYISILHNGFMTVFLKSGLVGVFIFMVSIYLLFKRPKVTDPVARNINLIMLGTGIYMIISAWVFMGFYFNADTKSILVGYLVGYRELLMRKTSDETAVTI